MAQAMRWVLALLLAAPLVLAEGISVTAPAGELVAGTTGVVWHPWVEDWSNSYDVYFAQRTYENGTVVGEIRTLVCDEVIGNYCDADTTVFIDGQYVAIVTTEGMEGYSNDFQILNHPPHAPTITVIEPRGDTLNETAAIAWDAADEDADILTFDAFLVKRLYTGTEVTGEERTILCTTTTAGCSFDTTVFENGEYAVAVRASDGQHAVEGYSNTFIIMNAPHTRGRNILPEVVVIEPRGVPLSGLASASWGSTDADGDTLTYTVSIVSRITDDDRVIGEASTVVCTTAATGCEFDTAGFADGQYVLTVTADDGYGTATAYSNDFTITNPVMHNGGRGCCRFLYEETGNSTTAPIEINESISITVTSSQELEMQQPPALGFTDIQAPPTHNISSLAPAWSLLIMSSLLLGALLFSTKVTA